MPKCSANCNTNVSLQATKYTICVKMGHKTPVFVPKYAFVNKNQLLNVKMDVKNSVFS